MIGKLMNQSPTTIVDGRATGERTASVLGRRNVVIVSVLFAVALLLLVAFEVRFGIPIAGQSRYPHYVFQAQSFLRGRWDLSLPTSVTDVVLVNGKHYIVYPPFPAVLLLPFVAVFGLSTSDILFTTLVAACNLPLLYLLFEQARVTGISRRIWLENLIISLFCYFGSINLYLSLGGEMWFTAHIVCMTFTLLSLIAALRRYYAWSAVLLGCAFFSRATVALGFPFLFYLAAMDPAVRNRLRRFVESVRARAPAWSVFPWRRVIPVAAVTCLVGVLFLVRNAVVFGSPLESGYAILIQQHYAVVTTGPFNVSYIPANIVANFFTFPQITFTGPFDRHPALNLLSGGYGVSPFVTTPLFLLLFSRNQRFSPVRAGLWGTIALIVTMILFFHAAGWYQFGARYLFDAYPYAFLLLALNEVRVDWRFAVLGLIGIIVNALGAAEFWTGQIFHL